MHDDLTTVLASVTLADAVFWLFTLPVAIGALWVLS